MSPDFNDIYNAQNPSLGILLSLTVGFLSTGVCPCTLPMGLGVAAVTGEAEASHRRFGIYLLLAFSFGIAASTALSGAVAGKVGALLTTTFGKWWALAMAVFTLLAAAIAFTGPRLGTPQLVKFRRRGAGGSFLYGFVFSLGTATPPLMVLLAAAAAQGRPALGAALGLGFGAGRALPFLIIGYSARLLSRFMRSSKWRTALRTTSGSALLLASAYFAWVFSAFL